MLLRPNGKGGVMSVRGGDFRAQFSQPVRQIVMMLIVIAACCAGLYVIYPRVAAVFAASPWLNATIGVVFLIGVLACFLQVFQLVSAVHWIEDFARGRPGFRPSQSAAAAGAAGGPAAFARAAEPDRHRLVAVDPRFRRHPPRRGARHHPVSVEPADLPRASRHLLRPRHHHSGGGADDPRADALRGRKRQ